MKRKNDEISNLYQENHVVRFSLAMIVIVSLCITVGVFARHLQLHWIETEKSLFSIIPMTTSIWTFSLAFVGLIALSGMALVFFGVIYNAIRYIWDKTKPEDRL